MFTTPPSILFVNRVFPPDRGATGRLLADLAARLALAGWRVTVVVDGPQAAVGDAPPGVTVRRAGGKGVGERASIRAYGTAVARLTAAALTAPRHDIIVTMTDPPLLALAGPLLAARHGARLLHWCHDLYPALLPLLGRPIPGLAGLEALMGRALRRCDGVLAIGRCMGRRLTALGVPPERLTVLPNWADPALVPLPRAGNPFRRRLGIPDAGFVVLYAGTVGLAHPLGAVVDAARRVPEAVFLLAAAGRGRPVLERTLAADRPGNLRLLPWEPAARLAESLSAADAHLAVLDPRAEGLMVPSKVAAALAVGRPCLFLGPAASDAARLAVRGGGLALDAGDGAGLAAAVRRRMADPDHAAAARDAALAVAGEWDADRAASRVGALAAALLRPERGAGKPPWGGHHG